MYKEFEVTIDLSRSSREDANKVLIALAENGYSVYYSYDTFEGTGSISRGLCFNTTDKEVIETTAKGE